MLDTTIQAMPVTIQPEGQVVMRAYTVLYDKRSKPCFASLPQGGVVDVSSTTTSQTAYSIVMSKLARFAVVCGTLQDFVHHSAQLLIDMVHKHYSWSKSWALLRRFVARGVAPTYGETNQLYVLAWIKYTAGVELGKIVDAAPPPRHLFYTRDRRGSRAYKKWLRLPLNVPSWQPLPAM
jgi:hypothetical protein